MTPSKFFFDTPIYTEIEINEENSKFFADIIQGKDIEDFDGYNPFTQSETTYTQVINSIPYDIHSTGGYLTVRIKCKRSDNIFWFFLLYAPSQKFILKIGQFPSLADFHISEVKQYKKFLPADKLNEFTKAIGLAAHGVGIGSFVYLRRIFEFLILDAFNNALKDGTISAANFQNARMDEKIDLLRSYLPAFLVQHKKIYSILSLGIHELDEKDCLEHFDVLRVGIEIILDEKLDGLKRTEKLAQASNKITEVIGKVINSRSKDI